MENEKIPFLLQKEYRRLCKLRDLYESKLKKAESCGSYSEYLFYNMLYCRIVNDIDVLIYQKKFYKK